MPPNPSIQNRKEQPSIPYFKPNCRSRYQTNYKQTDSPIHTNTMVATQPVLCFILLGPEACVTVNRSVQTLWLQHNPYFAYYSGRGMRNYKQVNTNTVVTTQPVLCLLLGPEECVTINRSIQTLWLPQSPYFAYYSGQRHA